MPKTKEPKQKPEYLYINEKIKNLIEDTVGGQTVISKRMGISQSRISQTIKEKPDFQISSLFNYAKALKVSILEIILPDNMYQSLTQSKEADIATIIDIYDLIRRTTDNNHIDIDYYQHQQATKEIYEDIKLAKVSKTDAYQKDYILKTLKEMFNLD